MKKIAVVTATRAEYGLLAPLIKKIQGDEVLDLDLIVTGAHLSNRQGHTIDDIIRDGFPISHEIDILDDDNTPYGISLTMSNALRGFAECFRNDRPNLVILLGDRTELLSVASAALNERIPIAHIHGGEVTEGAVDDCIRHAITKMSFLHFTSTEEYRRRVIQLGEDPTRVFNVGALGAENILNTPLMSEQEIRSDICVSKEMPYAVVTYHPETLGEEIDDVERIEKSINENIYRLCKVMSIRKDIFFLVTGSNADAGGERINKLLLKFCEENSNALFIQNLGTTKYLSAIKHAAFVMGNSSSGIIEAPVMGTVAINIGDRQKGRIMPDTVLCCKMVCSDILEAMHARYKPTDIFGTGNTSDQIVSVLKVFFSEQRKNLMKGFYDICMQ